MSEKKNNFIEWSGKTYFNITGVTRTTNITEHNIKKGKITIDRNRPVLSTMTKGVKRTFTSSEEPRPKPIFSGGTKLSVGSKLISKLNLESVGIPFTAGTVDTSFPSGVNTGFNGQVNVTKVLSNGKILVGGEFDYYYYNDNTYYSTYFIRLNSDGSPDLDFMYTYNCIENEWYVDNYVNTIDIQSDGKIIIGGEFNNYNDDVIRYSQKIMRFNSDGSFDDTFYVGNGFEGDVKKIIIQPNGKILATGGFYSYNNSNYNGIIRLNPNGSRDLTFNPGSGVDGYVYDMILQPDGKIILGGDFNQYDNNTLYNIVRINSDGSYDNTFQTGDGFDNNIYSLALQSDGKVIVGGYFSYYDNNDLFGGCIVRLDTNGALDTRFGYGLSDSVFSLKVQSDDKILVGGYMGTFYIDNNNELSIDELVRFNSDCTIDYGFYYGELFNNGVLSIELDSNNKVYVGGEFYENIGGDPRFVLNRFGRLNNEILKYHYTYSVVDCSILTVPIYYNVGSNTPLSVNDTISISNLSNPTFINCGIVTDLNPSTTINYEYIASYEDCNDCFINNSKYVFIESCLDGVDGPAYVSPLYNVGDILYLDYYDENIDSFVKSCFNIVEELSFLGDPSSFPIIPYKPIENCESCVSCNGVYYIWEDCQNPDISGVILSNQYMSVGDTFALPIYGEGEDVVGLSPCKTVVNIPSIGPYSAVSGSPVVHSTILFNNCEDCLTQMVDVIPGEIDNTFNVGLGSNDTLYGIKLLPNDKILVNGYFTQFNGVSVGNGLIRLSNDGSIDSYIGGVGFNDLVRSVSLQSDSKLICSGEFQFYNGISTNYIIRLNPDFSIDDTFNSGTGFNQSIFKNSLLSDNKILVSGGFTEYDGTPYNRFIRLNSDGSIDTSFNIGTGFDGFVRAFAVQPDGKIVISGFFTEYDGTPYNKLIRLNSDGSIDTSFNIGTGFDEAALDMLIQPDGKIIIIGEFTSYNGTPYNRLIRLNSDGSIDTSFNMGTGFDDENPFVFRLELLPDGKLLINGRFTSYNGVSIGNGLVKLNSDGSLDTSFVTGTGFDYTLGSYGIIYGVGYTSDNKIYVCGIFNEYNGDTVNQMVRLDNDLILKSYNLYNFTTCGGDNSYVYLPSSFESTGGNEQLLINEINYLPITSSGLDLIVDGNYDDNNFIVDFPTSFGVNFLGTGFTSVNVSSNPFITFGSSGNPRSCCFDIPNEIPSDVGLPGIFLSFQCPNRPGDYDANLYRLYTGLTDGGNTMIIRYEGTDLCDKIVNLTYNFKFYKNQFEYFDLVIEENTSFFNDNPTGGASDGVNNTWLATFDSSSETSWRIGSNPTAPTAIKAYLNNTLVECGTVGNEVTGITDNMFSLYYSNGVKTYENCSSCVSTVKYRASVKNCFTNEIKYVTMTQLTIERILNSGPIFSEGGVDCYEMLNYCPIPDNDYEMSPYLFYGNCKLCLAPLSAGTEVVIYQSTNNNDGLTIIPPHATWTNGKGKSVVLMDTVVLGGMFGLNA